MKILIMSLTLFVSSLAWAYSDEAINDAEKFARWAQDRFNVGEITNGDVYRAQAHVVEMKYQAGRIPKTEYCSTKIPLQEGVVTSVVENEAIGMGSIKDIFTEKTEYYRLTEFCK